MFTPHTLYRCVVLAVVPQLLDLKAEVFRSEQEKAIGAGEGSLRQVRSVVLCSVCVLLVCVCYDSRQMRA